MSLAGLRHYLSMPHGLFFFLSSRGLFNRMSDEAYLKRVFQYTFGYALDLEHPKSYNEKLQWLKLHDRDPLYPRLVDKYEVKNYITEKIGPEYVVPVVGGPWDCIDEIDLDALPDQFVMKCTHDSGSVIICKDKSAFDFETAKNKLAKALRRNYYWSNREWPYKDVKPRVYAEKYLDSGPDSLNDYKVMCFDGKVKLTQVHMGRFQHHTQDFYDADWNLLDIYQDLPLSGIALPKPEFYEEMCRLSEIMSEGFLHLRVDWLYWHGQLYLGELTFYDGSGFMPYTPAHYEQLLGSWIHLPCDEETT